MSALKSKDGKFTCPPEHAVEVVYMLSNCEAHLQRSPQDKYDLFELIREYLKGNKGTDEVNKRLNEWRQEDEVSGQLCN
jgi:hypothetical protein